MFVQQQSSRLLYTCSQDDADDERDGNGSEDGEGEEEAAGGGRREGEGDGDGGGGGGGGGVVKTHGEETGCAVEMYSHTSAILKVHRYLRSTRTPVYSSQGQAKLYVTDVTISHVTSLLSSLRT